MIQVSQAQGMRDYQEDCYVTPSWPSVYSHKDGELIGVFDGHGGEAVSLYMQDHFVGAFLSAYDGSKGSKAKGSPQNALRAAFAQMQRETKDYIEEGCTASVVWITRKEPRIAVCAVIGDSPIIIGTKKGHFQGPDHNAATNKKERAACEDKGALWTGHHLVRGFNQWGINMTRAVGDNGLKFLRRTPQIFQKPIHDFVLVASDGLFPSHANRSMAKDVVEVIRAGATADQLVKTAVAIPTGDNVTCVLWRKTL